MVILMKKVLFTTKSPVKMMNRLDLRDQVQVIVTNVKVLGWMRSFSRMEQPDPPRKETFKWMDQQVIPFWMFPDNDKEMMNKGKKYKSSIRKLYAKLYLDKILNADDREYFDEYDQEFTRTPLRRRNKVFSFIYDVIYVMTGPKCPIIPFLGASSLFTY